MLPQIPCDPEEVFWGSIEPFGEVDLRDERRPERRGVGRTSGHRGGDGVRDLAAVAP